MKFVVAAAVAATCALAKPLQEASSLDYQYMQYTALFNKHSHSLAEYNQRMTEFGKVQKFIADYNGKVGTHFLGHNAYSDWTDDERAHFLSGGIVGQLKDDDHIRHHFARLSTEHIPDRINWVEFGAVSPVRHESSACQSSWAHTAIDVIEGDVFLKTGNPVTLSVQQFLDCDHESWGCHGGLFTNAFEHAMENPVMTEKDYPFKGEPQPCKYDKTKGQVKVSNFINILPHDADQLKVAVKLGPVAASITTTAKPFQFYKGGIISKDCSTVESPVDSAVTIVGYGRDPKLALDYWLIKNSWGKTWGDAGFARIAIEPHGPGVCNIQTEASVVFTN